MSTESAHSPTDVELLHGYLGRQLDCVGEHLSLDDALAGFQEYYRQLNQLRAKVRQAEESLAVGHSKVLDVDALVERVRTRLQQEGVDDSLLSFNKRNRSPSLRRRSSRFRSAVLRQSP